MIIFLKSKTKCVCICQDGFSGDGYKNCSFDPCSRNDCHQLAKCIPDKKEKYLCSCPKGYRGDGKNCFKHDPCSKCDKNAICDENQICQCNENFVGDGFFCRNSKPCTNECPDKTVCIDGKCTCIQKGYKYEPRYFIKLASLAMQGKLHIINKAE